VVKDGQASPLDLLDSLEAYQPKEDWGSWRAFLAAVFGLPMSPPELALYRACTGRQDPPTEQADEAWAVVGRRGGKGRAAAIPAAYLACYRNYAPYLAAGQWGLLPVIAGSKEQAGEMMDYLGGLFEKPPLSYLVEHRTETEIRLVTRVEIKVRAASFRTVRAPTVVAAIVDEVAYWRTDDGSRNPDSEIMRALRPAMATIPGSLLLGLSSPYAQRGVLWDAYDCHYGVEGDRVLVWQAPTDVMHPAPAGSHLRTVIDRAYADDPVAARAEYGGEFRADIQAYVPPQVVDSAVQAGVREVPPDPLRPRHHYAFLDPSGGGPDAYALAIAHPEEGGMLALDLCQQWAITPELNTMDVTAQAAGMLKRYGIKVATGDRYAGEWPADALRAHGITYVVSERNKSQLYVDALALLNGGRIRLLDNPVLIAQLKSLDRRTGQGRDIVDHPPGGHDDSSNAAMGALLLASVQGGRRKQPEIPLPPATTTWELQARRRDEALAKERERCMGGYAGPAGRTRYYRRPRW
jgi:hypothetical protein